MQKFLAHNKKLTELNISLHEINHLTPVQNNTIAPTLDFLSKATHLKTFSYEEYRFTQGTFDSVMDFVAFSNLESFSIEYDIDFPIQENVFFTMLETLFDAISKRSKIKTLFIKTSVNFKQNVINIKGVWRSRQD